MDTLGLKLRYFREKRNLTRKELVDGICDESTLFRIERGDNIPSMYIVENLCRKMNIPMNMLFEKESIQGEYSINSLKQLCRKYVYDKDFLGLSSIIQDLKNAVGQTNDEEYDNKIFIIWHEAILIHKLNNNPGQAKNLLIQHLSEQTILETEISMLNSLGLICQSLKQKKESIKYFQKAFDSIDFSDNYDDSTLPIRVTYNYAYQLYYQEKYLQVIDIINLLISYITTRHLLYMRGRTFHLLSKTYIKLEDYFSAKKYMESAIDIFKLENKISYKDKALKDLEDLKLNMN